MPLFEEIQYFYSYFPLITFSHHILTCVHFLATSNMSHILTCVHFLATSNMSLKACPACTVFKPDRNGLIQSATIHTANWIDANRHVNSRVRITNPMQLMHLCHPESCVRCSIAILRARTSGLLAKVFHKVWVSEN